MNNIFSNIEAMQANIQPLNINGLRGRMLRLPSSNKKYANHEILMLYGIHATLERVYGIAEDVSQYGNVTVPDYPGCGGMDSFYKIGMIPSIDSMADYLATFVKLRYRGKKVTIMGISLGFVIATRMLQKYPELVKKVNLLVSMVGFTRYDDFSLSKNRTRMYKSLCHVFKYRIPSLLFYNIALHPSFIKLIYTKTHNAKVKFAGISKEDVAQMKEFEVIVWRDNDVRTYMRLAIDMLNVDNCQNQIKLPVEHITATGEQYFDPQIVEQHMRVIFTDFTNHESTLESHAPPIIVDKDSASPFIPQSLRKILKQTAKKA